MKYSIKLNYQDSMQSLKIIETGLNKHQDELEEYFKKNNIDVHENWAFSNENRETIRELACFIKESTRECKEIPYHRLWQYFIAYVCIQKKARKLLWKIKKVPNDEFLEQGLREMKTYCKYAVGIYGKLLVSILIEKRWLKLFQSESHEEIFCKYARVLPENLIYSQLTSKKYLPAYAICIDPPKKSVILVIRGTMSVFDCMTDLKSDYTTYDYTDPFTKELIATGLLHSGIFFCAQNLAEEAKPRVLSCLEKYSNYSLYIVGHSLGAGAAALLGLIWMSDPDIMIKGFKAFAYAPPAVVSENLNIYLRQHVFSSIFGNDLVSRLSFGAVKDLCEMATFFHKREHTDEVKASEIASGFIYGKVPDDSKMLQLYEELQKSFVSYKLQPPGNVYQMYEKKKHSDCGLLSEEEKESTEEFVGAFVNQEYHKDIAFSKTTLSDHMPHFYEQALNQLGGPDGVYTSIELNL